MSLRAMIWAFEQQVGSAPAKLVLLKLADNANDQGECFPSLHTIARHTELNKRTVERHIKALEDRGLLSVNRRRHETGVNLPNVYKLEMKAEQGTAGGSGTQPPLAAESQGGSGRESPGVAAESRPNLSDRTSHRTNGGAAAPFGVDWDNDPQLFARGKAVLGNSAGGQIKRLKEAFGSVYNARRVIEAAAQKQNPSEYVEAARRNELERQRRKREPTINQIAAG